MVGVEAPKLRCRRADFDFKYVDGYWTGRSLQGQAGEVVPPFVDPVYHKTEYDNIFIYCFQTLITRQSSFHPATSLRIKLQVYLVGVNYSATCRDVKFRDKQEQRNRH